MFRFALVLAAAAAAASLASAAMIEQTYDLPGGASITQALDVTYDDASDSFAAFTSDFFATTFISISGQIGQDGAVLGSTVSNLLITDGIGTSVTGSLADVALGDDLLRLLFAVTFDEPTDTSDWGRFVLAELSIDGFEGALGLSQLDLGGFAVPGVNSTLSAQAIPVPAALPLLAGALGVFALVARRGQAGTDPGNAGEDCTDRDVYGRCSFLSAAFAWRDQACAFAPRSSPRCAPVGSCDGRRKALARARRAARVRPAL